MSRLDLNDMVDVSVRLLDKTYQFRCPASEQEHLVQSAKYLQSEIKKTRDTGVVGADRICLMTALNLAADVLQAQSEKEKLQSETDKKVQALLSRIDEALTNVEQLELE